MNRKYGPRSAGTGKRHGNEYYLRFLDNLFKRNQESPFPVDRKTFYNLTEEFWHAFQEECEADGVLEVYRMMKLNHTDYRKERKKEY